MKSIKFLMMAAMVAVSTSASAQFTNKSTAGAASITSLDGWSTVWVEYNPSTFNYDWKGAEDQSFTGLSVGYSKAFNVVPGKPFFLEAGLGLQYSFHSESEDEDGEVEYETKFSMFSAKIPVNFMYKYDIPNTTIALMPYVGLNLRYNFSAKAKADVSGEYVDNHPSYFREYPIEEDLFDEKDMGKDDVWKHFQIGWNIGVKARFGQNFQVGIGYGQDFSDIADKTNISTTTISLGYTF